MELSLQELVWQRAGHRCEYRRVPQERDRLPFEIDHIIAESHEGPTKASKLCLCCFACNPGVVAPDSWGREKGT
jgi:HNH endonuclease